MSRTTNILFILFAALLIIILIGAFIDIKFIKNSPETSATSTLNATATTESFIYTFTTGFEGYNNEITYQLEYPASKYNIATTSNNVSSITLKGNDAEYQVSTFNNEGAGFANATEVWNNVSSVKSYCSDCKLSNNKVSVGNLTNGSLFTNGKKSVYIFSLSGVFVIVDTPVKPAFQDVVGKFAVTIRREVPPSAQTQSVLLYFANNKVKPVVNCDEVAPVTRTIPKTQAVATEALKALLAGPTNDDQAKGFTSSIPSGSQLLSLKITNGTAYAVFNKATQDGGGSCKELAITTQIKQTLLQFPTIKKVILSVEGLTPEQSFQP